MKHLDLNGKRIIIAKTTHIGDVVISLPLAAILKQTFPHSHVIFMANGAPCKLAAQYSYVDEVCDWQLINRLGQQQAITHLQQLNADVFINVNPSYYLSKLVKQAGIPIRVGSLYRWYHWFYCNRLAMIARNRAYNKRQLDLQYLKPLGIRQAFSYSDINNTYVFKPRVLPAALQQLLDPHKFKLILHPSLITAKNYQWPAAYYAALIQQLPANDYQIFISGTPNDRAMLEQPLLQQCPNAIDIIGQLQLDDFLTFMQHCDGLIAGSTGPLHMAAAVGIHALGIYRPDKSYIKRWEPIGRKATIITQPHSCNACPDGDPCSCIRTVTPAQVQSLIATWYLTKRQAE